MDYDDMTLLKGIEVFFDAIKAKCSTEEEYVAELLKARGFLLEDNELALSDNSFFAKNRWTREIIDSPMNDANYLNELLTSENIGEVQGNKIIIFPGANAEKIFYSSIQYGGESFLAYSVPFFRYNFAPKVPVGLLEKFVARYVKALSACGVQTHGSCDGNHHRPPCGGICIEISGGMYSVWYEIICQNLLVNRFNLNWNGRIDKFDRIKLRKSDKWITYIELNRAAEFLYNNRIKIRQIRRKASDEFLSRNAQTFTVDKFVEITNKLFEHEKW